MKNLSTRSLLIDPINKTITEVMVPTAGDNEFIHQLIGCETSGHVVFGPEISIAVDDDGLYRAKRTTEPSPHGQQGYFVTHNRGVPHYLIAGKGVLWAYNAEGITVDLPGWVTPALVQQHVAFVADQHRNAAADLCQEILSEAGIAFGPEQIRLHQRRYAEIVRRAMALTTTSIPS